MLHARPQHTTWGEETNGYKPNQAAHNLAAMHYARDSWVNHKPNAGHARDDGYGGGEAEEELGVKTPAWTVAQAMPTVSGILMQSVEPLEDYTPGIADLLPMPNPIAPSSGEVRMVLMRRRMLDKERVQHVLPPTLVMHFENDKVDSGPAAAGTEGISTCDDVDDAQPDTPSEGECEALDKALGFEPHAPSEIPEESRLVLPVLESLIALRRARLTRKGAAPPAQQQQPHPPQRQQQSVSGDAAWSGVPPAGAKSAGKPTRRLAPGGAKIAPADAPTEAAPSASGASFNAPCSSSGKPALASSKMPASALSSPLSHFPGSWRATRKWAPPTDAAGAPGPASPVSIAAAAAADTTAAAVVTAAGTTAAAPMRVINARTPGPSWGGNEPQITVANCSFTAGQQRQNGSPMSGQSLRCPGGPASVAVPTASSLPLRSSRLSPRPSGEIGGGGGAAEGDPNARSSHDQHALLQQWQDWRLRGVGHAPSPGDEDSEEDVLEGEEDEDEDEEEDEYGLNLVGRSKPGGSRHGDGGGASIEDADKATWRSARRITQCFDFMGTEAVPVQPQPSQSSQSPQPPQGHPAAGPLSPMATRRGGDSAGRLQAAGSAGNAVWLDSNPGGGGGAATGGRDGLQVNEYRNTTAGTVSSPEGGSVMARMPSLTSSKHHSFTSKFAIFKNRIQCFSSGQLRLSVDLFGGSGDRAHAAAANAVAAGGPKPRDVGSGDGRAGFGAVAPDTSTRGGQSRGSAGATSAPDLQLRTRTAGRASYEAPSKPLQSASTPRTPVRTSLDSRMAPQFKGRFSHEVFVGAAPGQPALLPPQPSMQDSSPMMMVMNSHDRRRGEAPGVQGSLLPPVRMM